MSLLEETIGRIEPLYHDAAASVESRLDSLLPRSRELGVLRNMLLQYVGITGDMHPEFPRKCTVICCADHGVSAMGVSAYPPETTLQMTENYLISRGGTANALANFSGADLFVLDVGIAADTSEVPGLINRKIALGTRNSALEPAMTREQAVKSIETGIEFVEDCVEKGYRCFMPGEMGIGNTTASAAICAIMCGISPEKATGRGTNISDERLKKKVEVVKQILERNEPDPTDGLDVLSKLGGFELGCITGIILGAAANRVPVILDGFNTGAAALIAEALAPACHPYLMASHLGAERAHGAILDKLGLVPCMDLGFRLGEGTGSSIAANFLDAALGLYRHLEESEEKELPLEDIEEQFMPEEIPVVTDKTFDFYLNTMPQVSKNAMEECRKRIDHLAKPLGSLGRLEQIAEQLAAISGEERPVLDIDSYLLSFVPDSGAEEEKRTDHLSRGQLFAAHALSLQADTGIAMGYVKGDRPPTAAFDFGRVMAEDISFSTPIIGISVITPKDSPSIGEVLGKALLTENGELRYHPEEFLMHVPQNLKGMVSSILGALIAAAHNSSLIILDDEATEIIARYGEQLCHDIRPYILHVQPVLLQMGITLDGGIISCLGMQLVKASLHMLNDMKTFRESGVNIATDGPGADRQSEQA